MAKMYPTEWINRNGSAAEALVYRRLRDETPDDWIAVHSVGLTTHRTKPWAEIDFVVVGPFGALCLEVKGGRVVVANGAWPTNSKPLKESPFQQAGSATAALHGEITGAVSALRRVIVGHGVVLPDVVFTGRGAGIDSSLVYDANDLEQPMKRYLERLAKKWLEFHGRTGENFRPLSRSERSTAVHYLAPSFDLLPTLNARLGEVEANLIELTQTQSRVLRGMRSQPRALIRGGAGTGKTLLAVDEAARFAADGQRVLMCVRSERLASYIADRVEEPLVDVRSYRGLLDELVAAAGREHLVPDADEADLLTLFLPEQAMEAAADTDQLGSYDALVVDEAQDLMMEGALDVFDALLDGGLDTGEWRVFIDHKQNVFEAVDRAQFDRISSQASTQYELFENCRNTPQINAMTAVLAAIDPDDALANSGPEVVIRYVLDRSDEPGTVSALVEGWRRRGIALADIVVLMTDEAGVSRLVKRWPKDGPAIASTDVEADGIRVMEVSDFKGLESAAAVVVGGREISQRATLRSMYVGCSRPRALLAVVLDERAREDFDTRSVEYWRRHNEG